MLLRVVDGLLQRLAAQHGGHLAAAVQRFAEAKANGNAPSEHVYASFRYAGKHDCHLVVMLARLPDASRMRELDIDAGIRAYLEAFEERLPHGMPFCAFAVLPKEWLFIDFDPVLDLRVRDRFAALCEHVCTREIAAGPIKRYIWDDTRRKYFSRIGEVEIP